MGMFDKKLKELGEKAADEMNKNLKVLENHMITLQENQCEQEAYFKDIVKRLEKIEKQNETNNKRDKKLI